MFTGLHLDPGTALHDEDGSRKAADRGQQTGLRLFSFKALRATGTH